MLATSIDALVAELVEDIATEKPFIWAQPLQKKVSLMALRIKTPISLDFKPKVGFLSRIDGHKNQ
jgi:hypothetical protein